MYEKSTLRPSPGSLQTPRYFFWFPLSSAVTRSSVKNPGMEPFKMLIRTCISKLLIKLIGKNILKKHCLHGGEAWVTEAQYVISTHYKKKQQNR